MPERPVLANRSGAPGTAQNGSGRVGSESKATGALRLTVLQKKPEPKSQARPRALQACRQRLVTGLCPINMRPGRKRTIGCRKRPLDDAPLLAQLRCLPHRSVQRQPAPCAAACAELSLQSSLALASRKNGVRPRGLRRRPELGRRLRFQSLAPDFVARSGLVAHNGSAGYGVSGRYGTAPYLPSR